METISDTAQFHGYIIGLQIERTPDEVTGSKLYAVFEYGGEVKLKLVPDYSLFNQLSTHLSIMASQRSIGEYGYNKLWIGKVNGRWEVSLP